MELIFTLMSRRLKEFKDTCCITIFALDVAAQTYPVIASVDSLPFDSSSVAACPESIGGVIVMTSNSVLHVDVSGRTVGVAVNGWASQVSDFVYPNAGEVQEEIKLEGACVTFQDDRTLLVVLSDGTVKMVEILLSEGAKAVGKLVFSSLPTATGSLDCRTVVPSIIRSAPLSLTSNSTIVFVGSVAGPSALLSVNNESIEIEIEDADMVNGTSPAQDIVMDDEDQGLVVCGYSTVLALMHYIHRNLRRSYGHICFKHRNFKAGNENSATNYSRCFGLSTRIWFNIRHDICLGLQWSKLSLVCSSCIAHLNKVRIDQ